MPIVLEIDYQAAKRRLAAQQEYLFALEIARNKARAFGAPSDVAQLGKLIEAASWPDQASQAVVDAYHLAALARHERTQVPYDQMLFHADGQIL